MEKRIIIGILFLSAVFSYSQTSDISKNESFFVIPEIIIGVNNDANEGFPDTKLQTGLFVSLGHYNYSNDKEWARQLNYPKTGIGIAIIDFGNTEKIGKAYSFIPFAEFQLWKKWNFHVGMGGSYMDTLYDKIDNPSNEAISTHLNWTFKSFIHYDLLQGDKINWRLGLGYIHHSNGHTRLPNQGFNTFLASVSAAIDSKPELPKTIEKNQGKKTSQTYYSGRFGYGINVLSEIINSKEPVYSIAFSIGKIYNKTFKFGGGFYYRFYQNYYDYIINEGELLEEYPLFSEIPYRYATNYGLFASAEILLGHVGFEFDLGLNIHKPFYAIDWKLNEGVEYQNPEGETIVVLGELDWYYEIKRTISSRLGLKYYLINNDKSPKHNLYLGVHINGNLGQADFHDFSLGYVHRFELKERD